MKRSGTCCIKSAKWRLLALLLLTICFGVAGCTLFKASDASPTTSNRILWRSGQQNVRIERQDMKSAGLNDHPIVLAPEQIKGALAALEVRLKPKEQPMPVFTSPELDTLGKQISDGLAQAGPEQDVTFTVVGQRKALYGFAKERRVTTGRVFYREGKLNIIFGNMSEIIGQYDGTSAKPLQTQQPVIPGSRKNPVSHSWALETGPDMQFYSGGDMIRTDWVVLDLASVAAHEALGMKPTRKPRVAREEAEPARAETAPQYTAPAPVYSAPAPAVSAPQPVVRTEKPIEERLRILNDLKAKKLITDEEYKAKRANILNDL